MTSRMIPVANIASQLELDRSGLLKRVKKLGIVPKKYPRMTESGQTQFVSCVTEEQADQIKARYIEARDAEPLVRIDMVRGADTVSVTVKRKTPNRVGSPVRLDLRPEDLERLDRVSRVRGLSRAAYSRMAVLARIRADEEKDS